MDINYKPKVIKESLCEANNEVYADERVCVKCGESAHLIQGYTPLDVRLEQFYCDKCNTVFVCNEYGKFIRYGVLKTDW